MLLLLVSIGYAEFIVVRRLGSFRKEVVYLFGPIERRSWNVCHDQY